MVNCKHPSYSQRYGITEQPRHIEGSFTGLWPEEYYYCTRCGEVHGERFLRVEEMSDERVFRLLMQMDVVESGQQ